MSRKAEYHLRFEVYTQDRQRLDGLSISPAQRADLRDMLKSKGYSVMFSDYDGVQPFGVLIGATTNSKLIDDADKIFRKLGLLYIVKDAFTER
ncbi:MAG: hypothetical protein HY367_02080 [Candidatus Aenigmarchaeota archaeon]|nr:hypothetical protein [Candidatus Aenigmarchaeota archaeon]